MSINDVTSDKMRKCIENEDIPNLLAKMEQAIEYYNKTNTIPKYLNQSFLDKIIYLQIDFRNKLSPDTMIIGLEWRNE